MIMWRLHHYVLVRRSWLSRPYPVITYVNYPVIKCKLRFTYIVVIHKMQ